MPRAHLCQSCGHDLALLPAAREPRYGWLLVRCPSCAAASVRAEGLGGDRTAWRRARKAFKALLRLVGRSAALFLLTLLMTATVAALEEETRPIAGAGWRGPLVLLGVLPIAEGSYLPVRVEWFQVGSNLFLLAGWVFGCLLSVGFLLTLLRHLRWWALILGWAAWIIAVMFAASVVVPSALSWAETGSFGLLWNDGGAGARSVSPGAVVALEGLMRTPGHVAWGMASGLMMLALVPVGVAGRRLAAALVRAQRWRIRKRIRRRNQAA